MADAIAVTATGVLSAAGTGAGAVLDAMLAGRTCFTTTSATGRTLPWPVARLAPELAKVWPKGESWDGNQKYANGTARLAVGVARQATAALPEIDAFRGATVVAVSSSGGDELSEVMPQLALKARDDARALPKFLYDEVPDYSYIRGIPSQMGQFVSIADGFRGSNVAVYGETGVQGLGALGVAARLIESGEVDAVMVVGISPAPSVTGLAQLEGEEALAEKAGPGAGPFDAARRGTLVGQGAAAVVLERASLAAKRGARELARLSGVEVLTTPSRSTSLAAARRAVLGERSPAAWFANASGSPVGDAEEVTAVATGPQTAVTSTRGTIGTAFETAALIDVAVAVEAMARGLVPPVGLLELADPALDPIRPVAGRPVPLAADGDVLVTAWNHGDTSGAAGAALLTPGGTR